jgi:hypothetical protein
MVGAIQGTPIRDDPMAVNSTRPAVISRTTLLTAGVVAAIWGITCSWFLHWACTHESLADNPDAPRARYCDITNEDIALVITVVAGLLMVGWSAWLARRRARRWPFVLGCCVVLLGEFLLVFIAARLPV